MEVQLRRLNDHYLIEASNQDGKSIFFDTNPEIGGVNGGVRPMEGVLMSLASCSSIDVISILKKQKQQIEDYSVKITSERVDTIPKVFKSIHLEFILKGDIDENKVQKAINLSMEKYCSVTKMLESTVTITTSFKVNQ